MGGYKGHRTELEKAIQKNRLCVCGHGAIIHKRNFCSRFSCPCEAFEELTYGRVLTEDLRPQKRSQRVKEVRL
jgi:hypothetical protein